MRTQSAFIIWTAMVLRLCIINGQTTDPSPDVRSPLNEGTTSIGDLLESRPSAANPSVSSPWSGEVTHTPSPQQPGSPSAALSLSPAQRDETETDTDTASTSAPGSSSSSSSPSYVKSTVFDPVATTAPTTFVSPDEAHQSVSTAASSQKTQTSPPFTPTPPHTSEFVMTSSSKVTGPAPLEDQDQPPELDVGDQDSENAPHRPASPLDPLLAALVTIFIICTAMVSAILFLRFRQRSEHPEFHRLQDLPMDDLLEDTPLSRYNY